MNSEIFYYIITVAVAIASVLLVIVLVHVLYILRDVRHVSEKLRFESGHLMEDIADIRSFMKGESIRLLGSGIGIISAFLASRLAEKKEMPKAAPRKTPRKKPVAGSDKTAASSDTGM
ncbi:hypothetical protein L0Y49_00980 [bacterium]|nr:hypothetical protein [bacterium]MCI0565936.1 hypothetical protein [bacterium]